MQTSHHPAAGLAVDEWQLEVPGMDGHPIAEIRMRPTESRLDQCEHTNV